jgi:hypothetical protein
MIQLTLLYTCTPVLDLVLQLVFDVPSPVPAPIPDCHTVLVPTAGVHCGAAALEYLRYTRPLQAPRIPFRQPRTPPESCRPDL